MNRDKFIKELAESIQRENKDNKILPSLLLAQGILESAWGTSTLSIEGKNLFGIKARTGEPYIVKDTKEFLNNKWITVKAKFRKYKSYDECIRHAINRYLTMPRYSKVIGVKDYKIVSRLVWEAGYATDPKYPEKLINIIEAQKLYEFDKKGESNLVSREKILNAALMLQSKNVKYRLGAKAVPPNIPSHLDCSGFVRYCYLIAGANVKDGTWHQWHDSNSIKLSDLRIGDLGFKQPASSPGINHIGIYAGDGKWIHCNASRNGITLEKTNIFPYIRRFKGINFTNVLVEEDEDMARKPVSDKEKNYGVEAIKNLAKLNIINSPEKHIKDLDDYPWDWKMWVIQNNIVETIINKKH